MYSDCRNSRKLLEIAAKYSYKIVIYLNILKFAPGLSLLVETSCVVNQSSYQLYAGIQ